MHFQPHLVLDLAERFTGDILPRAVIRAERALSVDGWAAPGEPIPFARMLEVAEFEPVEPRAAWGRPWGTTWFLVRGSVPEEWDSADGRIEASVDLGFSPAKPGFQCEGLVRTLDGTAVKGLEPRNHHVPLDPIAGREVAFYVEAASNADLSGGDDFGSPSAFAPTPLGDLGTAGEAPLYRLGAIAVRWIDTEVEALLREVIVLKGLAAELSESDPRRASIVHALERALAIIDTQDVGGSAAAAREMLAPVLARPAASSAHRIVATGHAHIDSAWLWPSRETVRKVTRTFANVLDLMDRDPDAVFACSSAQHYAWVRDADPALFTRVRERVAEGRFVPVGGMWVESDLNMPSGESLARQLLYGTRFFLEEFGVRSSVGWLPDSFGYPAALPQLLRRSGMDSFFAQKMCWNDSDEMPHHSFLWEGADGSRVFTHFPPNNTYSGDMRPTELARSVHNFRDHGAAGVSLMPFGYGDGGGGPTREMMHDARLQADLEGSPTVRFGTPEEFFAEAEAEYADPPVWSGEMYLQFHRGVFVSQARTKRGNRRNEALLVEAELWAATAALHADAPYPYDEFDALWREVLLLQFHDILPGSAIAWVHREAETAHTRITEGAERLIAEALARLSEPAAGSVRANPSPFAVRGVPAFGIAVEAAEAVSGARAEEDGSIVLESEALRIVIAADGTISSFIDRAVRRELIPRGGAGGVLQVHHDQPARWDAWELDRAVRSNAVDVRGGRVRLDGRAAVVQHAYGSSVIRQRISLDETGAALRIRTTVDWHERQRLLKLSFPLDVHAQDAAYESAFGHTRRPVHRNTSWDDARFEVCAHRWVHVAEAGYGVVIANDAMYGHDTTRFAASGHAATVVRQSLLRAPTFPDPDSDQGEHIFETLVAPAATVRDAARWGATLGSPLRDAPGAIPAPLVALGEGSTAVVSAVKLAADRSGDLIVRLSEQEGARTEATITVSVPWRDVTECDLVELPPGEGHPAAAPITVDTDVIRVELRPFQIITLRFSVGKEDRG